jgi:Peptidyl-prolyl cis-trans isomerase (rotamase) - cyclophilin family
MNEAKLTYGVIAGLVIVLGALAYFLQGNIGIDLPAETPSSQTSQTPSKTKTLTSTSTITSTTSTTMPTISATATKAVITTNKGVIEVTFASATAPLAVSNFEKLAVSGFYDGTRFHRVINDFMIQGGDPLSKDVSQKNLWGTGGPGYTFKDETSMDDKMVQGVVAMANAGPNTNGSQFFIITAQAGTPWLVGKHTIFGHVTKGMDVALKIQAVQTDGQDKPLQDIIVEKVEIQ